jgi:UDP:flavonoid glycosyltransferase YjiC (YdhE family)
VQPYVALGVGLREAGHEVVLATYAAFEGSTRERGLGFHPVTGDPKGIVSGWLAGGRSPVAGARAFRRQLGSTLEQNVREYREACRDAEVVIFSPLGFHGYAVSEKLGIPAVGAAVQPLVDPTGSFPSALLGRPPARLGPLQGPYNRLTYHLAGQAFWQTMRPVVDGARRSLGLAPYPRLGPFVGEAWRRQPILYGWSERVLPRPTEWGEARPTTGPWFLDRPDGWRPPEGLAGFLEDGPPPVSVGFGSTIEEDPKAVAALVAGALRRAGRRGVLLTGWGGLKDIPASDDLFVADAVPHDWLFPRVAAAVHHGGAGTTAASLRAGLPTVVVHSTLEEAFWGWRVEALGAGPAPIPRAKLSVERLARALVEATTDAQMQSHAHVLGGGIRSENGVTRAVGAIERIVAHA